MDINNKSIGSYCNDAIYHMDNDIPVSKDSDLGKVITKTLENEDKIITGLKEMNNKLSHMNDMIANGATVDDIKAYIDNINKLS